MTFSRRNSATSVAARNSDPHRETAYLSHIKIDGNAEGYMVLAYCDVKLLTLLSVKCRPINSLLYRGEADSIEACCIKKRLERVFQLSGKLLEFVGYLFRSLVVQQCK